MKRTLIFTLVLNTVIIISCAGIGEIGQSSIKLKPQIQPGDTLSFQSQSKIETSIKAGKTKLPVEKTTTKKEFDIIIVDKKEKRLKTITFMKTAEGKVETMGTTQPVPGLDTLPGKKWQLTTDEEGILNRKKSNKSPLLFVFHAMPEENATPGKTWSYTWNKKEYKFHFKKIDNNISEVEYESSGTDTTSRSTPYGITKIYLKSRSNGKISINRNGKIVHFSKNTLQKGDGKIRSRKIELTTNIRMEIKNKNR